MLSRENKHMLQAWLDLNIEIPYPSKEQLLDLQTQTKLSQKVIQRWLENQRRKQRQSGKIIWKCSNLSQESRSYLTQYFQKHQNHSEEDIDCLAKSMKCRPKQIETWLKIQRKLIQKRKKCPVHDMSY
jgi:hypothetical protein